MAHLMHQNHPYRFREFNSTTVRSVNFIFGLLLFAVAMFFMFSREAFMRPGFQVDGFILILSGVISIWASMLKRVRTVFFINIFLGALLYLGSMMIWSVFGHTGEDFIVHIFIGTVFFYNAFSCRKDLLQNR